MTGIMQQALGSDWNKLPIALQTHYDERANTDSGSMDIEYPRYMQPYLFLMHKLGGLLDRRASKAPTIVKKSIVDGRQFWRRTITYPDGKIITFNSAWRYVGGNQLIEYVNAVLGLKMAVHVQGEELHYEGVSFVAKLGSFHLPIPEWLVLGHTTIVERALSSSRFAMDFRVTHPLFGQVFRYAGEFETSVDSDL
jgi:hypothetical protein